MPAGKLLAIAARALATTPTVAQGAPVSRAIGKVEESSALKGTTLWIAAAIGRALLVWGAVELPDDGAHAVPDRP